MTVAPRNMAVVRVIDDEITVRHSWQFLLEGAGWTVRTYPSAESFLALDDAAVPGCILLDICMQGMSGLQLQHELTARGNPLPIIFSSAHGDINMAVQAIKDGACDFLPKPVEADRLVSCVQNAVRKDAQRRQNESEDKARRVLFEGLTEREKQIARLIARGMLNKQIANELCISDKTVQVHRSSILHKLGAINAADITRLLVQIRVI